MFDLNGTGYRNYCIKRSLRNNKNFKINFRVQKTRKPYQQYPCTLAKGSSATDILRVVGIISAPRYVTQISEMKFRTAPEQKRARCFIPKTLNGTSLRRLGAVGAEWRNNFLPLLDLLDLRIFSIHSSHPPRRPLKANQALFQLT